MFVKRDWGVEVGVGVDRSVWEFIIFGLGWGGMGWDISDMIRYGIVDSNLEILLILLPSYSSTFPA